LLSKSVYQWAVSILPPEAKGLLVLIDIKCSPW